MIYGYYTTFWPLVRVIRYFSARQEVGNYIDKGARISTEGGCETKFKVRIK